MHVTAHTSGGAYKPPEPPEPPVVCAAPPVVMGGLEPPAVVENPGMGEVREKLGIPVEFMAHLDS